jgi:preprotein translocase subunit SecG
MEVVVLSIHLLVCICLIGLVLLQRSEGGALGMGGGGSGALMSGRGAADALARMTSVAGGFFLVTSLTLTVISGANASSSGGSVFDRIAPSSAPATPAPTPAAPPADNRPDPTESSIAADTQLASITPGPTEAAAAPATAPSAAAARAAPLTPAANTNTPTQRTSPVSVAANNTSPRQPTTAPATQRSASTNAPASQRGTTTPTTQRTANATNQGSTGANAPRQLVLPNTSGSVTGIALEETPSQPESVEVGNGLEAVRRQTRAGPDQ